MMNEISAEEFELLGLFEEEPQRQGLDDAWQFDDSVYTVNQGGIICTCAIHPYHKDVRLMLWAGETNIYEFSAMGVQDMKVHGDTLQIYLSNNEVIIVTVRPSLNIKHETIAKT